ncbi:hypothetical protein JCGZ_18220 [Jatropha curcas]|uniref:Uncharacterized protein n=1 Tax=Jatropha curcas TaxID=180498 RepID=A0A067LLD0_JATCU|nr:uncharacterized protein LOC105640836 [Jatropha curcas]KDP45560.1 hypothetical protein JCGZ_18220 [Jatropha curcas]
MSSGAFARGAHSMFSKPGMVRKACHRKNTTSTSSGDNTLRGNRDGEETKMMKNSHVGDGNGMSCSWVPDERTGIYHPKGQEKVIDDIPQGASKDFDVVNYFSHN